MAAQKKEAVPSESCAVSTPPELLCSNRPWQYKWKRPIFQPSKMETSYLNIHAHDHRKVQEKVRDMIPIDSVSAQISYSEALSLLEKSEQSDCSIIHSTCEQQDNALQQEHKKMDQPFKAQTEDIFKHEKWEDLESSSDEGTDVLSHNHLDFQENRTPDTKENNAQIPAAVVTQTSSQSSVEEASKKKWGVKGIFSFLNLSRRYVDTSRSQQGKINSHPPKHQTVEKKENMMYDGLSKDDDFNFTVTILASSYDSKTIDFDQRESEDRFDLRNKTADAVLLEVTILTRKEQTAEETPTTNCQSDQSSSNICPPIVKSVPFSSETIKRNEQDTEFCDKLLLTKLLYWPVSALVNTDTTLSTSESVSHHASSSLSPSSTTANSMQCNDDQVQPSVLRKFLNSMNLKRFSTFPELHNYSKKLRESEVRAIKRRKLGLTNIAICRRRNYTTIGASQKLREEIDAEDTIDLLEGMNFGIESGHFDTIRRDLFDGKYITKRQTTQEETTNPIQHDSCTNDTGDLILSCLTNDGKLHVFSALDLMILPTSVSSTQNRNIVPKTDSESLLNNQQPLDALERDFASLFLGHELHSAMEDNMIPFSQPLATIELSLIDNLANQSRGNVRNKLKQKDMNYSQNDDTSNSSTVSSFRRDSNNGITPDNCANTQPSQNDINLLIEERSHRPVQNPQTICVASANHIIVAGVDLGKVPSKVRGGNVPEKKSVDNGNISDKDLPLLARNDSEMNMPTQGDTLDKGGAQVSKNQENRKISRSEGINSELSSEWKKDEIDTPLRDNKSFPTDVDNRVYNTTEEQANGGFLTLISLKYLSEVRNLFLPFAPKLVSPIVWNNMNLVVVVGDSEDECFALRTDFSSHISCPMNNLCHNKKGFMKDQQKGNNMFLKRFTLVPISILSSNDVGDKPEKAVPIAISSVEVSPPSILLYHQSSSSIHLRLHTFVSFGNSSVREERGQLMNEESEQLVSTSNVTILTRNSAKDSTHISKRNPSDTSNNVLYRENIWSVGGQGWNLVGIDSSKICDIFFILWDGGLSYDVFTSHVQTTMKNKARQRTVASRIMPTNLRDECDTGEGKKISSLTRIDAKKDLRQSKDCTSIDGIILDAINDIMGLSDRDRHPTMISNTLLTRCPSWAKLNDTIENRSITDHQIRVACIRFGSTINCNFSLSLRRNVVMNGATSPFQEIIPWLCRANDFGSAATIGLHLLEEYIAKHNDANDSESNNNDKKCVFQENHLLDSIMPLNPEREYSDATVGFTLDPTSNEERFPSDLINLADMTLSCMIKGGGMMSQPLERFLTKNKYYNTSRACLMLTASSLTTISQLNKMEDSTNLAPYSYDPLRSETHTLWHIQCLLRVAVTRNYIVPALLLLNSTIPNQMRNRAHKELSGLSVQWQHPPVELCKSIISMILASCEKAPYVLLSLVDDSSQETFWDSLEHKTRLVLSLLPVRGKSLLLRECDVRDWALEQLSSAIEPPINYEHGFDGESIIPSEWLSGICTGVLNNAGSEISHIDDDYRVKITSSPGMGGIDFDLIIPSLLLLQKRSVSWNSSTISTQQMLSTICSLAGQHTLEEPRFTFDDINVMKQCSLANNILAASYLVAGHDGLILKCVNALIKYGNTDIIQAERFLSGENMYISLIEDEDYRLQNFELTEGHKDILLSIQQHVLSVTKYGQFESTRKRGNINPIFAAKICLRTWLFLMKVYPSSGVWLENWFRIQQFIPQKPLACATLIRALLWSDGVSGYDLLQTSTTTPVLANYLNFSPQFLIDLSKAACGKMECLPPSLATEMINRKNTMNPLLMAQRNNLN